MIGQGEIETRILEGPNVHFPKPAVELAIDVSLLSEQGLPERIVEAIADRAGLDLRTKTSRPTREIVLVAFTWERRGTAEALAEEVGRLLGNQGQDWEGELQAAAKKVRETDPGGEPEAIDPQIPVAAVTGTNGKTTVTRLLAHIGRVAGRRVSWCNTDGIFLDGETLEEGDWSGPDGAQRAVTAAGAELAVLEVARGGLLRRGMGVTQVDVAVVTNVSADHLGEFNITDLDRLADVKTSILTAVRPRGWAVINADDPRVFARRDRAAGRVFAFATDPAAPGLEEVLNAGGRFATVEDNWLVVHRGNGDVTRVVEVAEVPLTLAGISRANISNALAATAAALGLGFTPEQVAQGLRTFLPDPSQNPGRMNMWELDGKLVVVDYAHNAESLHALLEVLDALAQDDAQIWLLIGTAGDRTDEILKSFAEAGARGADQLGITEKEHFLRGRTAENMIEVLRDGAARGGKSEVPVYPTEQAGLQAYLTEAAPGDVVSVCAHLQRAEIFAWLDEQAAIPLDNERLRALLA